MHAQSTCLAGLHLRGGCKICHALGYSSGRTSVHYAQPGNRDSYPLRCGVLSWSKKSLSYFNIQFLSWFGNIETRQAAICVEERERCI